MELVVLLVLPVLLDQLVQRDTLVLPVLKERLAELLALQVLLVLQAHREK
jgi:hypothetical protein